MSVAGRKSVKRGGGAAKPLLFESREWDFGTLSRVYEALERIAEDELGLDIYRNQIEVITSEQMLDAYASTGMPMFYKHWSFGKHFVRNETLYRKGWQGLAYEIVINSDPCLVYIMEENSAMMQTLVLAHAAFGHNHFFKNNYAFKQWTDASSILDYLAFAKTYIADCEERYGADAVERLLDAAHALMSHGIHRYPGKHAPDLISEQRRQKERGEHAEKTFNVLWRTLPKTTGRARKKPDEERRRAMLGLPEENLLYFLEKTAPRLAPWQREVLRIVRQIAQYFYPQRQTKVMNEGCACFVHYKMMSRLHEAGRIPDGAFMEFLHSHTSVIMQPDFDDRRYSGINPYSLGFAMTQDIERIATSPTAEDRAFFPDFAGCGDPYGVLKDGWANYRDESFILQFLSPALIRKHRMFQLVDDEDEPDLLVASIHNENGYRAVRQALSRQFDVSRQDADIQVVDVNLAGDRRLLLRHQVVDGVTLDKADAGKVLQHLANLWGYDVRLVEADDAATYATHDAAPINLFQ
ncbi:SpoVR family protein [Aurantimonas sp. VKM B-3413]|uniref:SpoVR family protein n=1 Tax=Aurantimonas sp. VKM B-3413 TaxID=2779401 RepID=UPI001E5B98D2|nr:SpoVR family protein [Aurantimonas sp. VKM B-3413]MCB8839140.1 SpoVR family protein [Aurantimonas sp. VKM B-3413]